MTMLEENEPKDEGPKDYSFREGAREIIFNGPLNLLLVCVPFALLSNWFGFGDSVTFFFALLSLAPVAERLGFVTEQLAIHTNETIGGLLNATFGNATELIVAIAALSKGLYKLVQLSLLGSILSNMLLVLGTAFFFGGLRYKTQYFGKVSSQINSTLLMVSTAGVLLPTMLSMSGEETSMNEVDFSRWTSLFLFLAYFAFLYFQLKTHKDEYEEEVEKDIPAETSKAKKEGYIQLKVNPSLNNASRDNTSSTSGGSVAGGVSSSAAAALEEGDATTENSGASSDEEEEEEDILGLRYGILWLTIITIFVTILSDMISSTIEQTAQSSHISGIFLSAILLPIVGNAAEHAGAILFAMKGKMDLSLGVAIGSSTQIAVCVLPFSVLVGWFIDRDMTLNFGAFESGTLVLAVITGTIAIKDGKSNWLMGACLVLLYFIISVGFWAHNDDTLK